MDKGYDGITKNYPEHALYLPHKARRNRPLTADQRSYNRFHSSYRIVVGHTNAQLNQYQALSQGGRYSAAYGAVVASDIRACPGWSAPWSTVG